MLDDPPDLAAYRITLAPPQILDLLGDMLAVETVIGNCHRAQHQRLVLRPGIEIIVVVRSIRHGRHYCALPNNIGRHASISQLVSVLGLWGSQRSAAGDQRDRRGEQQHETAENDKTGSGSPAVSD